MRPAFRVGDDPIQPFSTAPIRVENTRIPTPSAIRPAFKPAAPRGRTFLGKDVFRAQEIREKGIKVSLGDTTLAKLLDVKIPLLDPDGNEVKDSRGKTVMISKKINLGAIGKTLDEKLEKIREITESGQQAIQAQQEELGANLVTAMERLPARGPIDERSADLIERGFEAFKLPVANEIDRLPGVIDGRFLTKESISGGAGEGSIIRGNATKVGAIISKLIEQTPTQARGKDRSSNKDRLRPAQPLIGLDGKRRSASQLQQLGIRAVIDLFHTDSRGRLTPTVFPTIEDAQAAQPQLATDIPDEKQPRPAPQPTGPLTGPPPLGITTSPSIPTTTITQPEMKRQASDTAQTLSLAAQQGIMGTSGTSTIGGDPSRLPGASRGRGISLNRKFISKDLFNRGLFGFRGRGVEDFYTKEGGIIRRSF